DNVAVRTYLIRIIRIKYSSNLAVWSTVLEFAPRGHNLNVLSRRIVDRTRHALSSADTFFGSSIVSLFKLFSFDCVLFTAWVSNDHFASRYRTRSFYCAVS